MSAYHKGIGIEVVDKGVEIVLSILPLVPLGFGEW